jgi:hypothetical protein
MWMRTSIKALKKALKALIKTLYLTISDFILKNIFKIPIMGL